MKTEIGMKRPRAVTLGQQAGTPQDANQKENPLMVSLNQTGESKKSGNANSRRQGTITHTPIANDKNVYRIRYTLPAEKNGKQKRVTETIRGTKTYAQKTLTKRLAQLEAKRHVDKTKLTVARFIQDWFGNHIADDNITLRTAEGYRGY